MNIRARRKDFHFKVGETTCLSKEPPEAACKI